MGLSIRVKVLALVCGAVLLVACAAHQALGRVHERNVRSAAFDSLRSGARFFSAYERNDSDKLSATADALLGNDDLREAFLRRDRAALERLAEPIFRELRDRNHITHWYFIAPDHVCFLRVHSPELHGDRIDRVTLGVAEKSGKIGVGKELGRTAFALRVVRPYRDRDGSVIGFVELGEEIDHFLVRMKEQIGDDFALVVSKTFLDERMWSEVTPSARNTWNDRPDVVVVDTTTYTRGIVDFGGDIEEIPDDGVFLEEMREDGRLFVRGAFPVRDAAGRQVGALFVMHDFTEVHRQLQAGRTRGLAFVLGLSLVVLVAVALLLERLLFARLDSLARVVQRFTARGKEPQRPPPGYHDADEIRRIEILLANQGPPSGEPQARSDREAAG